MKRLFELIDRNFLLSNVATLRKKRKEKEMTVQPLITISREFGSGGSFIAERVAKKLGKPWKLYHEEIVDEISKETKLQKKLIEEVDESNIPLVEEIIDDFFGKRYLGLGDYYQHLVKTLTTIGQRGYAVIVGRGGNFLFPKSLRIRILGDDNFRTKTISKYKKVSEEKAAEIIAKVDKKRSEFTQNVFHHDPRKAHHYDLTLQVGDNLTVDEAIDTIVHLARRKFKL